VPSAWGDTVIVRGKSSDLTLLYSAHQRGKKIRRDSKMNKLLMELTIMVQLVPQLLVAWLLLHWFAREAEKAAALAVASQRKRAQ
jgi:hypothetical protein